MIPVAILAGGTGGRLMPLTARIPKPLVPVDGVPFLEYQLSLLAVQGVEDVVLCVGHLGEQIEAAIGDGRRFGLCVRYSYDGPDRLGTGGALAKALSLLGSRFGVLYGDTYPLYDLLRPITKHHNAVTMAVRAPGQGNARYEHGRVTLYSPRKGLSHGDAGFSVIDADAFEYWQEAFELSDVFSALSQEGCIDGYLVDNPVYEIGSHAGLEAFRAYVSSR